MGGADPAGRRYRDPFRPGYGYGHLLRLHVDDSGRAYGRFVASAGFMLLRGQRPPARPPERSADVVTSATRVDPRTVVWDTYGADLAIGAHVPGCREYLECRDDGSTALYLSHSDGSWAEVEHRPGQRDYLVRQAGPRRLWADVVGAYMWWLQAGRPERERFGITVTPDRQCVWLDDPHGPVVWELDADS